MGGFQIPETPLWMGWMINGVLPEKEFFQQLSVLLDPALSPAVREVKHHAVKQTAPERRTLLQLRAVHLEKHQPTWWLTHTSVQEVPEKLQLGRNGTPTNYPPESRIISMFSAAPSCRSASSCLCGQVAVTRVSVSEDKEAENEKFPSPTSNMDLEGDMLSPSEKEVGTQKRCVTWRLHTTPLHIELRETRTEATMSGFSPVRCVSKFIPYLVSKVASAEL